MRVQVRVHVHARAFALQSGTRRSSRGVYVCVLACVRARVRTLGMYE